MRRYFRKKGFSLVELVVVLAIIGILLAMIIPSLSTREANKKAVQSAARDFYAASQHLFTKYSKFEDFLSSELKTAYENKNIDGDYIMAYDRSLGGNYPSGSFLMLTMDVKDGKIINTYCHTSNNCYTTQMAVMAKFSYTKDTAFGKMFAQDVDPLFSKQDGTYYCMVDFINNATDHTPNTNTVRVVATGYSFDSLPIAGGSYNQFLEENLLFTDFGEVNRDKYFGCCSSYKMNNGLVIGEPGTYFEFNP